MFTYVISEISDSKDPQRCRLSVFLSPFEPISLSNSINVLLRATIQSLLKAANISIGDLTIGWGLRLCRDGLETESVLS